MFANLDKRKLLLIGGVVLAIIVLIWLIFLAFRPPTEPVPGVNEGPGGPGTLPSVGNLNINTNEPEISTGQPLFPQAAAVADGGRTASPALTSGSTLQPFGSAGSSARYYDESTCEFYEIQPNGDRTVISQNRYCNVQNVTWSPDGKASVLEFPDGANIVYDFASGKQYTLPKEMTEFSFDPSGSQVAGKYLSDTNTADNWIVSVSANGSQLTPIEPMGENADKVDVAWSANNQVVALSRTGEDSGVFSQEVLLIGFNDENFRSLQIEGRGFEPQWTSDGQKLLYSVYSDQSNYLPTLYLVNANIDNVGTGKVQVGLNTWADKCTIAGGFAYCAVPQGLPEGAGFTRSLAQGLPDEIWQVDLATGGRALLAQPVGEQGQAIATSDLAVSADGRFLYFTDAATGQLRSVQLKP
ncbi:MAG: hypothetical protein A2588_00345 [Candidatus Veblenbacteria bacterium RIFOXYD1_FULL_43_11]|uniref:Dipeptidylpeptidase IV N-terminal domain-containing protein n=1 Tax=Candidatus Veblenbacteria bacterium RIFOXYD1_FULL_43_11 TaxID=1802429 RepID=A0A1G2Q9U1_9BACT|nr:MAG: hypothetical protein A2588_00345 [Candidatus Veblenbacteria bacterium RIFOXYD1_FULL_43_11]